MKRRKYTAKFKAKVVLESLKEHQVLNELAQKYKLSPSQISNWKKEFISNAELIFSKGKKNPKSEKDIERDRLLKTIGEQKVELDFLKNSLK